MTDQAEFTPVGDGTAARVIKNGDRTTNHMFDRQSFERDANDAWADVDGGRMAGASASAIAADPSLSVAKVAPAIDDSDAQTEGDVVANTGPSVAGSSSLEAIKSAGFEGETVRGAMAWMEHGPSLPQAQLDTLDAEHRPSTMAELGQLWGADKVKGNLKAINELLDSRFPPNVALVIRNARDATGRAYANDSAILQRLLGLAKQARPAAPGAGGDVDAEIKSIEAFMRRDRSGYNKSEQTQARYRELLTAKHGATS